jgi:hypothetical protein
MIAPDILNKGLMLLSKHFGRELLPLVLTMWSEYLSDELSNAEFQSAVKHAILHSRFMPTAGELVDFINGGKESKAIAEWQTVLAAAAADTERAKELLAYASMRCQTALQAIGGLNPVAIAETDYQRGVLQKQFTTVYCQCPDKDMKVLPQASSQPTRNASKQPQDYSPIPKHVKEQMEALKAKMSPNKKDGKIIRPVLTD